MNPRDFKLLLRRAVLLPLLTMTALAGILLWESYDLHNAIQWVEHTDQAISSSRRLYRLFVDMESGVRGYLLTGKQDFLEPYQDAQGKVEGEFQSLYDLVADNPPQQERLQKVLDSRGEWESYAARMVELRRMGGPYNDTAANLEGKRLMDTIRGQLSEFQNSEEELRQKRNEVTRLRWEEITITCVVVGIGFGVLIAYFTFFEMNKLREGFEQALDAARSHADELARSEQRWVVTLQSIGDAVMATDAEGKITFVNPLAESLLEMASADCLGRSTDDVFRIEHEETGAAVESPVRRAIGMNRVIELGNHVVLLGNKGARTAIADSAAPIRDASGRIAGAVVVFRDMTERRKQEDKLAQVLAREQSMRQIAEETVSRLRKLEQVTEATLAHLPMETMLDLLVGRVASVLQTDSAQLLLLNRRTQMLEVRTSFGLDGTVTQVPLGQGVAGQIAETGELRMFEDLAQADVFDPSVGERVASMMGAPLLVEDRVIGVLIVGSKVRRKFTEDESSLLQIVADRVALAIEGKQAEESLRASKELLENFIKDAPVALAMFDREMRYLQFSQRWAQDTGWKGGNLMGMSHYEAFPDMPGHWKQLHQRGLAGESLHSEEDWVAGDGQKHAIRWEIHPWGAAGVGSGGIIISFADLTELKQTEAKLRENELQFRTLANAIPQLCWMANPDGGVFWYNERWYAYTGTTAEQMEGWGWQSVHDPKALPEVMLRWQASLESGEPFDMVFPLKGADGRFRPFLTRVVPVRDAEGRIVRWFGTNTDISQQKRVEEALRASEERWSTTLRSIGDAVISTDAEGRIIFMNEVAQKMTGWSLEEAQGRELETVFNIVQELTRIRPENPVAKVLRSGQVVGLANHTLLIRKDGTEVPIEDCGAPIRDANQKMEGVVLVFHDVSEHRKIEKAIRESERLATTGRLAATIAHEIHNPLDAVGNLLYLVQQGSQEEETRNFAALASEELHRVTQMTQQMLKFQRESANPIPVKIQDVLDNVLALYERKMQAAGVRPRTDIEFNGDLMAQPGEVRQVFANLVSNAIEAMPPGEGGALRLRAYASRNRRNGSSGLRIVVADNGRGIPREIRERIFDPFFTTKGESGTGLGLWITAGIVEKYGGTLRVRSTTREGRSGTCFSVFFPVE